jgi:hypothetical protein
MKKKPLYIFALTVVFIAPILYWLGSRWGVAFAPGQLGKIVLAYSRDRFLLLSSIMNIALYIFCVTKVAEIGEGNPNPFAAMPAAEGAVPSYILASNTMGQINPRDEKWQGIYGGARTAPAEKPPAAATATQFAIQQEAPANGQSTATPKAAAPETSKAPSATPSPMGEAEIIDIANDNIRGVFLDRINDELAALGYETLGGASIDGVNVDFVGIAASDTLVLGILNSRHGDIIANETPTSPGAAPSWYTAEQRYDSPVWEIRTAAASVGAMINEVLPEDNDIKVVPVVVIPNASVANMADMEKRWEEAGVAVARFMNYSDLPDFASVLPDKRDAEVLPSYRKFADTLLKYFAQKAKRAPMKKAV